MLASFKSRLKPDYLGIGMMHINILWFWSSVFVVTKNFIYVSIIQVFI